MEYICFGTGIVIILIAIFFAYKKRYNTKNWIAVITFGILLSVFFMVLPTEWAKSENALIKPLYSIISALLYSLKTISGRQDVSQLQSIGFSGVIRYIYFIVNYLAFFISPVLGSGLILSFVGDSLDKIRYALPLFKKVIVFSELNKSSLLIAKGLKKKNKKILIVFCKTKNCNAEYLEEAKKLYAVNLHKACSALRIKKTVPSYDIYLISEDETKNSKEAKLLLNKYGQTDKNITVNAFIKNGSDISMLENLIQKTHNTTKSLFDIRFIDKTELFCYNLLYNEPIFNTPADDDDISVMIIGCGETGICILKAVCWYGQIYGKDLEIKIYDSNADKIQKIFSKQCPELNSEFGYDIEFVNTDINTTEFEEIITKKNNQAKKATVAYVFTGNDELNIETSEYLYRIFRKNRNFGETPKIFTWIKNELRIDQLSSKEFDFLKKRNIRFIGDIEQMYADNLIFRSDIENIALATHIYYDKFFKDNNEPSDFNELYNDFLANNYDRRSSMSAAIHFNAKLYAFKKLLKEHNIIYSEKNLEDLFNSITSDRSHPITIALARNEHSRWNAYIRSEGYCFSDIETMEKYAAVTGKNKDELSKLHCCLTDWDSLDNIQNSFNNLLAETNQEKKNFKESDFLIIENIFNIKRLAKELESDSFLTEQKKNTGR